MQKWMEYTNSSCRRREKNGSVHSVHTKQSQWITHDDSNACERNVQRIHCIPRPPTEWVLCGWRGTELMHQWKHHGHALSNWLREIGSRMHVTILNLDCSNNDSVISFKIQVDGKWRNSRFDYIFFSRPNKDRNSNFTRFRFKILLFFWQFVDVNNNEAHSLSSDCQETRWFSFAFNICSWGQAFFSVQAERER